MAVASQPAAVERDLRLDFFRGLALFCIFLDHLPNNILAHFTFQSVMFADAAEVFILISGYTAGMVYGRVMARQGFVVAGIRVYQRLWQLYVAHVFLFMLYRAVVAYTAVDDVGNVLHEKIVEGQIHGGVAQGIGQVLGEQVIYGDDGQLLTASFMDYFVPRASDVPRLSVHHHAVPCTTNPLGSKGAGESGVAGSLPSAVMAGRDTS